MESDRATRQSLPHGASARHQMPGRLPKSLGENFARQAAARALRPCMMVRLMSISGATGMAFAMTWVE